MIKYLNEIIQGDSLKIMKQLPDKSIDLVLCDPPYGINIAKTGTVGGAGKNFIGKKVNATDYGVSDWDKKTPKKEYFDEMIRVSKNQIIFGGNYFTDKLPQSNKWIVWDKKTTGNFSRCELIWTSFVGRIEKIDWEWNGFIQGDGNGGRIREKRYHHSQKPLGLIKKIINDYSEEGQIVLDPFLGSGTTALASKQLGRNYLGIELNSDYIKIAEQRLSQNQLL